MGTKERLETLRQRKAKLDSQLASLEAKEKARERKEDNRLKILIGAAFLADVKINPSTENLIKDILARAITAERDKDFLIAKEWPQGAVPKND